MSHSYHKRRLNKSSVKAALTGWGRSEKGGISQADAIAECLQILHGCHTLDNAEYSSFVAKFVCDRVTQSIKRYNKETGELKAVFDFSE